MEDKAARWAQGFENKSESELRAMRVPDDMVWPDFAAWKKDWMAAIEAAKARESQPLDASRETVLDLIRARGTQSQPADGAVTKEAAVPAVADCAATGAEDDIEDDESDSGVDDDDSDDDDYIFPTRDEPAAVPAPIDEGPYTERELARDEAQLLPVASRMSLRAVPSPRIGVDAHAPFARPRAVSIARDGNTEDLLNGLIAECHLLMRAVTLPSAMRASDAETRMQFLNGAMRLAETGAIVGKAVAKVRGAGAVNEIRQRHISEHIVTTPAPLLQNGAKT